MIDIEKEVVYWRDSALKDLRFASRLIEREEEKILYGFLWTD